MQHIKFRRTNEAYAIAIMAVMYTACEPPSAVAPVASVAPTAQIAPTAPVASVGPAVPVATVAPTAQAVAATPAAPVGSTAPPAPPLPCTALEGNVGSAPQWGSGWLDLNQPTDFAAGGRLKISVSGDASKVLVRLLPKGQPPDQPVGIQGTFTVPASRIVEVKLSATRKNIVQISVHGNAHPWTYNLGDGNGRATLSGVEYCK